MYFRQPVVTNESIGFGTNYISLTIPIRKAGEKVVMSNMNEIKTDLEVVNGKPVVTVKNGWYPLKEGVDYTLSWEYLKNQFKLQVTVNGIGTYTGSMVGDTELASKFDKATIKSLVGEIPGVTDEDTGSDDDNSKPGSSQDNNNQPATAALKKGDTFYNGKYRYPDHQGQREERQCHGDWPEEQEDLYYQRPKFGKTEGLHVHSQCHRQQSLQE